MAQVLRLPLDPTDGNLIRSQVTAAIGAVNAQLRADEHQLRRKTSSDVLDRLQKLIEEKKKQYPQSSRHRGKLPSMWNWNAAMPKPASWLQVETVLRRAINVQIEGPAPGQPRKNICSFLRLSASDPERLEAWYHPPSHE
jgi:hypothetical protein